MKLSEKVWLHEIRNVTGVPGDANLVVGRSGNGKISDLGIRLPSYDVQVVVHVDTWKLIVAAANELLSEEHSE
jgi:hypothetical protein